MMRATQRLLRAAGTERLVMATIIGALSGYLMATTAIKTTARPKVDQPPEILFPLDPHPLRSFIESSKHTHHENYRSLINETLLRFLFDPRGAGHIGRGVPEPVPPDRVCHNARQHTPSDTSCAASRAA